VGYGDILAISTAQTVFVVLLCSLGASFTAYIIGNVISFISGASPDGDNVQHKQACIKVFMTRNGVSTAIQDRINAYFDFLAERWEGIDEAKILHHELSDNLRKDVTMLVTHPMILSCEYLVKTYDESFLRLLMANLEYHFTPQRTIVISPCHSPQGMYFIQRGSLHQLPLVVIGEKKGEDGDVAAKKGGGGYHRIKADTDGLRTLGPNDYFGHEVLDLQDFRNPIAPHYLVKSITMCELWVLDRHIFKRLFDEVIEYDLTPYCGGEPKNGGGPAYRHLSAMSSMRSSFGDSITPPMVIKLSDIQSIADTIKSENHSTETGTISGTSRLKRQLPSIWRGILSTFALYNLLAVPFRVAFMEGVGVDARFALDYTGDLFLLLDVILRLLDVGIYQQRRREYIRTPLFALHILAALPLEVCIAGVSIPFTGPAQGVSMLRLNKVLRARDIMDFVPLVEDLLSQAGHKAQRDLFHMANLVIAMLICAHWYGCAFYMIASIRHLKGKENNWAAQQGLLGACLGTNSTTIITGCVADHGQSILVRRYIRSLYWAITTLTTVGYGDVVPNSNDERSFAVAVFISGILVISFLISGLNEIVTQMDITTTLFRHKCDIFKIYQDFSRLPNDLRTRCGTYFNSLWLNQKGISTQELRSYLPPTLYSSMVCDIIGRQMKDLFFVSTLKDPNIVLQLASRIRLEVYVAGDRMFREGECADTLFFLFNGSIRLFDEVTKATYTNVENCIIGEGEFFSRGLQPCSAQAHTSAQAALLDFIDLWNMLVDIDLELSFREYLSANEASLVKTSTGSLIQKLKGNMKSSKIGKLTQNAKTEPDANRWIHPSSFYRLTWDTATLITVLLATILDPLGIGFGWQVTFPHLVIDVLTDVFFCMDIMQHIQYFAILVDGELIKDRRSFRPIYIKSRLLTDVLSILPLCYIVYLITQKDEYYWYMRILQLTRLRSLFMYTASPVHLLESLTGLIVPNVARRYLDIFLLVLISAHMISCTFLLVGRIELAQGHDSWLTNPIPWGGLLMEQANSFKYLMATFLASYTITTVGYGTIILKTDTERILAMITMLFGAVLCNAGVAAVIAATIEEFDRQAGANHVQQEATGRYLGGKSLIAGTTSKVRDFFRYRNTSLRNINEGQTIGWFSENLRQAFMEHYTLPTLKESIMFRNAPPRLMIAIARRIEPYIATPQEVLLSKGQKDHWVHVLYRGRVMITDSSPAQDKELAAPGSLLSNIEYRGAALLYSPPTCKLEINVFGWKSSGTELVASTLRLYVEIVCGNKRYRSSIRKGARTLRWFDYFPIKIHSDLDEVEFRVFNCTRKEDILLGKAVLDLGGMAKTVTSKCNPGSDGDDGDKDAGGAATMSQRKVKIMVWDPTSKKALGAIDLGWRVRGLQENEKAADASCDIVSESYSHLYSIKVQTIKELEEEIERVGKPIDLRLPTTRRLRLQQEQWRREEEAERIRIQRQRPQARKPSSSRRRPRHSASKSLRSSSTTIRDSVMSTRNDSLVVCDEEDDNVMVCDEEDIPEWSPRKSIPQAEMEGEGGTPAIDKSADAHSGNVNAKKNLISADKADSIDDGDDDDKKSSRVSLR